MTIVSIAVRSIGLLCVEYASDGKFIAEGRKYQGNIISEPTNRNWEGQNHAKEGKVITRAEKTARSPGHGSAVIRAREMNPALFFGCQAMLCELCKGCFGSKGKKAHNYEYNQINNSSIATALHFAQKLTFFQLYATSEKFFLEVINNITIL